MIECTKRQKEFYKGAEQHRCVNTNAEAHLQIVDEPQCSQCPVRQIVQKQKPCTQVPPCQSCGGSTIVDLRGFGVMCPYRDYSGEKITCQVTGLPVTPEICGRCDEEARKATASFGDKVVNYSAAIKKWVAAGRPTRGEEEVAKLHQEHCSKCELYDAKKHLCKACGCTTKLGGSPLTNKLKMGTEACPLGRFSAVQQGHHSEHQS